MSTRSKVFFGASIASAAVILPWVHYLQNQQRLDLRDGAIKDSERRRQKEASRQLNPEQKEREDEYEQQKELHKMYSKDQEVSKIHDPSLK
ncbi:hypothetical protein B9G98_03834 [Wickerhamiella sorbophila]|uniref:Protein PET117, mitochondrial n=1 Tax=Wickerhamiella sorbophila TaxID=45607 RepID=A0A2T0FMJ7_9ASCO|nr:hypothetical protein B9G98_03834 [Wickerhamiella sorbophila]PRT56214.1 hypothetical protein B9G98_03834 [Wickerhamiella sorbophila]